MHLQGGYAGTISTYVPIIHLLLHRLVWELGNQFSCLLWRLGEWQVWSLKVDHRHALLAIIGSLAGVEVASEKVCS